MVGRKRIVTSVTIDPEDKKKADKLNIKYSEAFDKGLKLMLSSKEEINKRKKELIKQKNKVNEIKAQIKLEENIIRSLNELKIEYDEIITLKSNNNNNHICKLINKYLEEVIKLKAMELNIPSNDLKEVFMEFLSEKTHEMDVEIIEGEYITNSN